MRWSRRVFKLTPQVVKTLESRGWLKTCHGCGKSFKVGELVLSVPRAHGRKWYCLKYAKRYEVWA